jgi:hypothetical protein
MGVEDVGLAEALEFADTEQVDLQPEPVLQRLAVVAAVARQALEPDQAFRVQVDLIGVRGEVVLLLVHRVGVGHDLLAGGPHPAYRARQLAQGGEADVADAVGTQGDALDTRIVGGAVERLDQIAQAHLGNGLALGAGDRARQRLDRELLDDVAHGLDVQRGAGIEPRPRTEQGQREGQHQRQEHQVQQQATREVDPVPGTAQRAGEEAGFAVGHALASRVVTHAAPACGAGGRRDAPA